MKISVEYIDGDGKTRTSEFEYPSLEDAQKDSELIPFRIHRDNKRVTVKKIRKIYESPKTNGGNHG